MLTIRQEQMQVLSRAEVQKFEEWMLTHVQTYFPKQCLRAGDGLKDLVRHGIDRAQAHGIKSKKGVWDYVDLMMIFGRDFDERRPWAGAILQGTEGEADKLRRLQMAARAELGKK